MTPGILQFARPAVLVTDLLTVVCGVAYPLVLTELGQVLFPFQANGSLIYDKRGNVVGSTLIAQNFTKPEYFHPNQYTEGRTLGIPGEPRVDVFQLNRALDAAQPS